MKNKKEQWFYINVNSYNEYGCYRYDNVQEALYDIQDSYARINTAYLYTIKFNDKEASIIDFRKLKKAKTQKVQAKPVKVKSSVKVKKIIVSPVSKLFKTASYKSRLSPKLASLAVKSMIPRKPPVVKVSKAKANKPVKKVVKIKSKK